MTRRLFDAVDMFEGDADIPFQDRGLTEATGMAKPSSGSHWIDRWGLQGPVLPNGTMSLSDIHSAAMKKST